MLFVGKIVLLYGNMFFVMFYYLVVYRLNKCDIGLFILFYVIFYYLYFNRVY